MNPLFVLLILHIILDIYMYFGLKNLFQSDQSINVYRVVYILSLFLTYYSFYRLYMAMVKRSVFSGSELNIFIAIIFTSLVTKLVFSAGMLFHDLGRLFYGLVVFIKSKIASEASPESFIPSRRKFLTLASVGIAAIPFFTMIYGLTKGKYKYTVERVKLAFSDLPSNFDGLKVVQISDIHAGSYDSIEQVEKGVAMVNELEPDIILFTGDLVNSKKEEIIPYVEVFGKLKSKYGTYAILGNHDYYGLREINGDEAKEKYWEEFKQLYSDMNFELLTNENKYIEIEDQKINVVGVENWGASHWFAKKGDLDKSLPKDDPEAFTILMSHDPTHWDAKVLPHHKHVHLTLSGHTHGFQFGINVPGFKWSPAQYSYPRWIGLYEEAGQYLYVNRGFGFLAFPGRIGMWPEISLIELKTV